MLVAAQDSAQPVELDQTLVGRLSRMDAMQQQEMVLAGQRRRQVLLHKIDHALRRLQEGEYGICLKCEEEIAEKRLEFDPTLMTCIQCARGDRDR